MLHFYFNRNAAKNGPEWDPPKKAEKKAAAVFKK